MGYGVKDFQKIHKIDGLESEDRQCALRGLTRGMKVDLYDECWGGASISCLRAKDFWKAVEVWRLRD